MSWLLILAYILLAMAVVTAFVTLHFSLMAGVNLKEGVPGWKAWTGPLNVDPRLYTELGNRYRRRRERYGWVTFFLILIGGSLRFIALIS